MEYQPQETELYSILIQYTNKNNSPYVEIEPFISYISKHAKKMVLGSNDWLKWTSDPEKTFWSELTVLTEAQKCELLTDRAKDRVYLPSFYPDRIKRYYQRIEENPEFPFPATDTIKLKIPESLIQPMGAGSELISYLAMPPKDGQTIIKIIFPEDFGAFLLLAEFIPQRLTELCLYKAKNYLKDHNNVGFIYNKMVPQLSGRNVQLKHTLELIASNPLDCYKAITDGDDFSYLFWSHFSIFVRNDIKRKKDFTVEDINTVQAIYILESFSAHYRTLATKVKEKEQALTELDAQLKKPPFLYNLAEIIKFTNSKGILLLTYYSNAELQDELKKLTTRSINNKLPGLLIVKEKNDNWFVSKTTMLILCAKMLGEERERIKNAVSRRWVRILQDYNREPAMDMDRSFNELLEQLTDKHSPFLANILGDPKLPLVYEEMEQAGKDIPLASRIFSRGRLLPFSDIYQLRRRDLFYEARSKLPFWYSIALFVKIASLLSKGKQKATVDDDGIEIVARSKSKGSERVASAKELESKLLPAGKTLDDYISDQEDKWAKLLDEKARSNLITDVSTYVRDGLRRTLRLQKNYKVTHENLADLAASILSGMPALRKMAEEKTLILYIELHLVKLLKNKNFS